MDCFFTNQEIEKRVKSSGLFFHEPRNRKASQVQWAAEPVNDTTYKSISKRIGVWSWRAPESIISDFVTLSAMRFEVSQ